MLKTYKFAVIAVLLLVYCFAFQGVRGLFEPDEGRYSAVSLQMINSGDWVNPRTHPAHEHWTKPPLTYWAIAGSILTFGMSEFAVRFPNALSFLICIMASFYLGRVFTPKRPWIVSLIFATFVFPATVCNGATTDFPVTVWETLAMCFFAHAFWRKKDRAQFIAFMLMWAMFGLAFLTKGPPGLLPLLSIIVFLQFKCVKQKGVHVPWVRGLFLMILVGGSWYVLVIAQNLHLLHYFLWDELALRVFSGHHERHSEWYAFLYIYVPVLIVGTIPWSYYTGKGFINSIKKAKTVIRSDYDEHNTQCLFLILWFLIPLSIFIVSKSNLPLYVLPLFIPLAVITAREIDRREISVYKLRYQIAVWCILIVLVRVFMGSLTFKKDSRLFAQQIRQKHSSPVEEIVFVNTRRALGLQFYTGSDIERIKLDPSDLAKILQNPKTRLWIVEPQDAGQFFEIAHSLDITMDNLGTINAWKEYVLFAKISDSI